MIGIIEKYSRKIYDNINMIRSVDQDYDNDIQ